MNYLKNFGNFLFRTEDDKYILKLLEEIIEYFEIDYFKVGDYNEHGISGTLYSYDFVDADPDKDITLSLVVSHGDYYLSLTELGEKRYLTCSKFIVEKLLDFFQKQKTNH